MFTPEGLTCFTRACLTHSKCECYSIQNAICAESTQMHHWNGMFWDVRHQIFGIRRSAASSSPSESHDTYQEKSGAGDPARSHVASECLCMLWIKYSVSRALQPVRSLANPTRRVEKSPHLERCSPKLYISYALPMKR